MEPYWIPFTSALLFATHPIHTEAVAWVSGIADLSATVLALLTFNLYIRSTDSGTQRRGAYTLSVVSFFLALLCKEPALVVPILLVAYDCLFPREGAKLSRCAKRYAPFLVAYGLYFSLRFKAIGGVVAVESSLKLSAYQYFIDSVALFSRYVEKLLLPIDLNVWHVFSPPDRLFSVTGMISLFMAAAFFVFFVVAARKRSTALLGFLFIVMPLLPTLYLPGLPQGLENAFTERYLYLPSFGFVLLIALMVAWTCARKPGWTTVLILSLSIVVVLYSIGTVTRNSVWKDTYSLWMDAARKSPMSAEPHNALGDHYKEQGMLDAAIAQYQAGIRLSPQTPHIHANLGVAYAMKGMTDKAVEHIHTALLLRPRFPEARDALGVIYARAGRYDEAVREFRIAVELNPVFVDSHKHLGIAYGDMGQTDKAVEYLNKTLDLNPDDADAHNHLGIAYGKSVRMREAVKHFEAAVTLKPDDADYRYNLARAYEMMGLRDKAEEQLRMTEGLRKK